MVNFTKLISNELTKLQRVLATRRGAVANVNLKSASQNMSPEEKKLLAEARTDVSSSDLAKLEKLARNLKSFLDDSSTNLLEAFNTALRTFTTQIHNSIGLNLADRAKVVNNEKEENLPTAKVTPELSGS